jgi:hypothetical protein
LQAWPTEAKVVYRRIFDENGNVTVHLPAPRNETRLNCCRPTGRNGASFSAHTDVHWRGA